MAGSLNNLASLYQDQGKYEATESLYVEALAMRQQLLGKTHPDVARSQWNLGVLYQQRGSYYLAEVLYIQALAIAQSTLGPHHPTTQRIQSELNSLLPAPDT